MGSFVRGDVLHSSTELHSARHVFGDGNQITKQSHCMPLDVDPSYESTYRDAHKGEFDRLRRELQIPKAGTFIHSDLTWRRDIRLKRIGPGSRTEAPVSVAYIPWERVQDFVKGEEARIDGPCKFVCQGIASNKEGKLVFPRWNNYSAIIRFVCNMQTEIHCAPCNVTPLTDVCGMWLMTLSNTTCSSPQVSLPVWTK